MTSGRISDSAKLAAGRWAKGTANIASFCIALPRPPKRSRGEEFIAPAAPAPVAAPAATPTTAPAVADPGVAPAAPPVDVAGLHDDDGDFVFSSEREHVDSADIERDVASLEGRFNEMTTKMVGAIERATSKAVKRVEDAVKVDCDEALAAIDSAREEASTKIGEMQKLLKAKTQLEVLRSEHTAHIIILNSLGRTTNY